MTYMLLLNCALKLVEEIILYYDARSKKHQISNDKYEYMLIHSQYVKRNINFCTGIGLCKSIIELPMK